MTTKDVMLLGAQRLDDSRRERTSSAPGRISAAHRRRRRTRSRRGSGGSWSKRSTGDNDVLRQFLAPANGAAGSSSARDAPRRWAPASTLDGFARRLATRMAQAPRRDRERPTRRPEARERRRRPRRRGDARRPRRSASSSNARGTTSGIATSRRSFRGAAHGRRGRRRGRSSRATSRPPGRCCVMERRNRSASPVTGDHRLRARAGRRCWRRWTSTRCRRATRVTLFHRLGRTLRLLEQRGPAAVRLEDRRTGSSSHDEKRRPDAGDRRRRRHPPAWRRRCGRSIGCCGACASIRSTRRRIRSGCASATRRSAS